MKKLNIKTLGTAPVGSLSETEFALGMRAMQEANAVRDFVSMWRGGADIEEALEVLLNRKPIAEHQIEYINYLAALPCNKSFEYDCRDTMWYEHAVELIARLEDNTKAVGGMTEEVRNMQNVFQEEDIKFRRRYTL